MNKTKKIIMASLISLALFGCSKSTIEKANVEYKDAYTSYTNVSEIRSIGDTYGINTESATQTYNEAQHVAIVTIVSIDGGSNIDEVDGGYVYPYTYGTMKIEKVYKGNMQEDSILNYTRMGGIIRYSDYYNSLSPNEKIKHDFLSKGIHPNYVKKAFGDDIDIEVGKSYLSYMEDGNLRSNNEYKIVFWEGGLREVIGLENASSSNSSGIKVFNNYTGEYESIEDVIK